MQYINIWKLLIILNKNFQMSQCNIFKRIHFRNAIKMQDRPRDFKVTVPKVHLCRLIFHFIIPSKILSFIEFFCEYQRRTSSVI